MPTPKVQELLGLGSPQAVHRLRTRGKLLGRAVGNRTWFPAWQFDDDRVRPDLPKFSNCSHGSPPIRLQRIASCASRTTT